MKRPSQSVGMGFVIPLQLAVTELPGVALVGVMWRVGVADRNCLKKLDIAEKFLVFVIPSEPNKSAALINSKPTKR